MAVQLVKKRSQGILGGARAETQQASIARNALVTFERMWGAIRLMADNHPSRVKSQQLFLDALRRYTEKFGALDLEVGPFSFSLEGQEIFRLDRPNENYIYRLYQDGIRELSFGENLDLTELERFVQILRMSVSDQGSNEDDIVTLLWEADLQSIYYAAVETFTEDEAKSPDAESEGSSREQVLRGPKVPLTAYDIMEKILSGATGSPGSDPQRGQDNETQKGIWGAAGSPDQDKRGGVRAPDWTATSLDATLKDLDRRLEESDQLVARKFGEIVFNVLHVLGFPSARPVVRAFREFALQAIAAQSEEQLVEALSAIDETHEEAKEKKTRNEVLREILKGVDSHELVDLVVERLAPARVNEKVLRLLQYIGPDLFPSLWEGMLRVKGSPQQSTLRELLVPFAALHASYLLEKLSKTDADAAALAIYMLRKVNFTPTAQDLAAGVEHPSHRVRIEVARMLPLIKDPVAQHVMLPQMLADPDEEVRLAVIRILVNIGGSSLEDHLLGVMRKEIFITRSEEEKRLTVAALGRVATVKSLPVVRDMALGLGPNGSKWDLNSRIAAMRLLGRVGGQEEFADLNGIARKIFGNKDLKAAAREAAEAIRQRVGKDGL